MVNRETKIFSLIDPSNLSRDLHVSSEISIFISIRTPLSASRDGNGWKTRWGHMNTPAPARVK
jgi:hypothetical protein